MAGSASQWLEQQVLGHTLGFKAMPAVTQAWIALCLATPTPTSTTPGTEVTGAAYARQQTTFALLTAPANIAANTATAEFPAAGTAWGNVGFFEVWSAQTAGSRLYWGPLVDPADGTTPITRDIQTGDIMRFTAGVIEVQAT